MKIAQVSPLVESVPPKQYGGTERIVSFLTEELVKQGHDVTLFASGDSVTQARLASMCPQALRFDPSIRDHTAQHLLMLEKVRKQAADFDIIHFHTGYLHFQTCQHLMTPHITTHHGRLDIKEIYQLYWESRTVPVVSISDNQRSPIPWANWQGTVYNGIPKDILSFHEKPGNYLAFLGRISPEKRVDRAIEIAKQVGMKIKIAAKIDKVDQDYFKQYIKPLFNDPMVEFLGEIDDSEKNEFLGNAYALVFPIDWPEPFGLVMIEAMACGTPIVAYQRGSVPEIIAHGLNGFIVDNIQDAVSAVERIETLGRRQCRGFFEQNFTSRIMAQNYTKLYERMLQVNELPQLIA